MTPVNECSVNTVDCELLVTFANGDYLNSHGVANRVCRMHF